MARLVLVISALILSACQPGAAPVEDGSVEDGSVEDGPVLVTVLSPAGSSLAPQTGLFQRYALSGPAEGLTLARLSALETATITAAYPAGSSGRDWRGPRLSTVLAAAGASGAGARVTALDGYAVEIDAARIAEHEPILALAAEGSALSLGGLGPVMVIWPDSAPGPDSEDGAGDWVWGVFALEALNVEPDAGDP